MREKSELSVGFSWILVEGENEAKPWIWWMDVVRSG